MTFFLFFLGLTAGSFINVLAFRYNPNKFLFGREIVGGRSFCRSCGVILKWYELIPVLSFLFQKGKCRSCGSKLSLQYPVVEIIGGLVFVFSFMKFQERALTDYGNGSVAFWIAVFLILLLLSVIDFRLNIIPDELNVLLFLAGIAGGVFLPPISFFGFYGLPFSQNLWLSRLFGFLFGALFFGLLIMATDGKGMGMGDLKLASALGFLAGWPDILGIVVLSFIIGAVFSVILIILKRKTMKSAIPFGPFLAIGFILAFFFGETIIDFYLMYANLLHN